MTNPIILYDHQRVEAYKDLCQQIQHQIDSGSFALLDLLNEENRGRPVLFRQEQDGWRAQQYVGLFRCQYQGQNGKEEVQVLIGSRFDRNRKKPFFLWRLVDLFFDESLLIPEDLREADDAGFFDALLANKLAFQLQKAWAKGRLRAYRSFDHNDSRAKGQLDVSRHIRENTGLNNGRIAYRTREYSPDNPFSILFLQAAAALRKRHPGPLRRLEGRMPEFRTALRTLEQDIPGWAAPSRGWVLEHTRRRLTNPIYRDYEPARITARAILRRLGTTSLEREDSGLAVTGLYLNIDELWEKFLHQKLFRAPEGVYHPEDLLGWDGRLRIEPDFFWERQRVVLDAKNRPAWGATLKSRGTRWKYVNDDVYQVLSYMVMLDCSDGGVIFPVSGRMDTASDPLPSCGTFWRIPVLIPGAEDYPEFCQKLDEELDRLQRGIPVMQKILF